MDEPKTCPACDGDMTYAVLVGFTHLCMACSHRDCAQDALAIVRRRHAVRLRGIRDELDTVLAEREAAE